VRSGKIVRAALIQLAAQMCLALTRVAAAQAYARRARFPGRRSLREPAIPRRQVAFETVDADMSRQYAVDPLEILFVREVMRTSVAALPADAPYDTLRHSLHGDSSRGRQRLYPMIGNAHWSAWSRVATCRRWPMRAPEDAAAPLAAILKTRPIVAYPDESLRMIVYRMAETGLTRFPVVDREHRRLIGMIALTDLLKARALNLDAEQRRERVLRAHIQLPFGEKRRKGAPHA
jgi:chloride channel protein, CIC family